MTSNCLASISVTIFFALTAATTAATTAAAGEDAKPWAPPPPPPDAFDWVQLTSGEWLKGEFIAMYDEEVEFDSDKLGLLTLDWDDVKEVRSSKPLAMRFDPVDTASGQVEIDEETVTVKDDEGEEKSFERNSLVSVASGERREIDLWTAKFSLGANYRSGNTDEREFSATLDLMRRTENSRFNLDYLGRFLETEGVESQNNHKVSTRIDWFLSKRVFLTPIFGEYYRDPFQNFDHRVTVGTGLGYQLIDTSKTEWNIVGGPGYRFVSFESVEPGKSSSEDGLAAIFLSDFDTEITDWIDFSIGYSGYAVERALGGYGHSAVSTLSIEIGDPFQFDISFLWDYIQEPQTTTDGTTPENSDFRILFGVGVEF